MQKHGWGQQIKGIIQKDLDSGPVSYAGDCEEMCTFLYNHQNTVIIFWQPIIANCNNLWDFGAVKPLNHSSGKLLEQVATELWCLSLKLYN